MAKAGKRKSRDIKPQISDEDLVFIKQQSEELDQRLKNELCWQIAELQVRAFDDSMKRTISRLKILTKDETFNLDTKLIEGIKEEYRKVRELWREPKIFTFNGGNFEKAKNLVDNLEDKIASESFEISNRSDRPKLRRTSLKIQADNWLGAIKEKFQLRFGKNGKRMFSQFIEQNIVNKPDFYNAIFDGKGKPPLDSSDFVKIRNTSKRQRLKKIENDVVLNNFRNRLKASKSPKLKRK